jgi:hypothetical protein
LLINDDGHKHVLDRVIGFEVWHNRVSWRIITIRTQGLNAFKLIS